MKRDYRLKALLTLFLLFMFGNTAVCQKVYQVKYESEADILIHYTDYSSAADVMLYYTRYQSSARREICDGIWFKADYRSQADFTFAVTEYESQADILVYPADYRSQASVNQQACAMLHALQES